MFRTALISMFLTSTALADTWTVDDDGKADFDNIQDAINASSNGDTILIAFGVYYEVNISLEGKAITISGETFSNGSPAVIINGESLGTVFYCINGETENTVIENLIITGGSYVLGGGMICDSSHPTITNCTFSNNLAESYGGGMFNSNSSPTLTNCIFKNNVGEVYGGGMYNTESSPVITDCTFEFNVAAKSSNAGGGGMFNYEESFPIITNCSFKSNSSVTGRGGGMMNFKCSPVLDGCEFSYNDSSFAGGGMSNYQASPVVTNCSFTYNTNEWYGAGMGNEIYSNPILQGCTFKWNSTYLRGGGISNTNYCNPILTDCVIAYNQTSNSAGGMLNVLDSNPILIGCTIEGNESLFGGGIQLLDNCHATLEDCIVSNNAAPTGAGMYLWESTVTITNSNINNNYGDTGRGIYADASQVTFSGECVTDPMLFESGGSKLLLGSETVCTVQGSVVLSPEGSVSFDVDDLDAVASLNSYSEGTMQGGLTVTNDSGSLVTANIGDIIPLIRAVPINNNFDSVVFPPMPEGLGLQLIEYPALRGGDTEMAAEVVEIEGANFGDPFSGGLDSPPIDIISFDADGDGRDEVAVLFGGTPGGVAGYSVSQDGTPTPIDGLVAIVGNNPVNIDAADLNNDGREDLIVANSTDNSITVLLTMESEDGSLYFDVSTHSIPGNSQSITCVASIDWDEEGTLDCVVGVDRASSGSNDGYQVLLDVSGTSTSGPWFQIPNYQPPEGTSSPDPPTCVDGGDQVSSWGFVGGTKFGRVHKATFSAGSLQVIGELNSNTVTIEVIELDANGGDGQIDLMVSSDEAETIYLFQGNAAESDGFNDLIPLGVSLPVEDVIAIDADDDGDMDIVMTAPDSDTPVILLRNDGVSEGFLPSSLGGQTWSMQVINSASDVIRLTSGGLSPKDDEDDWIVGGGSSTGFRGETIGLIEQSNILLGSRCDADVSGDGEVNVTDLLAVIDQWGQSNSPADINGDGVVDVTDLLEVVGNWGPCE